MLSVSAARADTTDRADETSCHGVAEAVRADTVKTPLAVTDR
jgi:hypothetical protein